MSGVHLITSGVGHMPEGGDPLVRSSFYGAAHTDVLHTDNFSACNGPFPEDLSSTENNAHNVDGVMGSAGGGYISDSPDDGRDLSQLGQNKYQEEYKEQYQNAD